MQGSLTHLDKQLQRKLLQEPLLNMSKALCCFIQLMLSCPNEWYSIACQLSLSARVSQQAQTQEQHVSLWSMQHMSYVFSQPHAELRVETRQDLHSC